MHTDAELVEQESTSEDRTRDDTTSLASAFERPAAREQVWRAAELFLITTLGFALAGGLAAGAPVSGGINGVTTRGALEAAVLSEPLLGTLTGVLTGLEYDGDAGQVLAVAGAGAGLGAIVCGGLVYFVGFSTFGTGVSLSIGALLGLAIATAITGALAGLVTADGR